MLKLTCPDLQQTPESSPKVILKIVERPLTEGGDSVNYLFTFNAPANPRAEANAVKELLSRLISEARTNDPSVPRPTDEAPATNGSSAAPPASKPPAAARLFDDAHLKGDIELQTSLLKENRELHQIFWDAYANKPDTISKYAFNVQFWSSRLNLLRAHAIKVNQQRGSYNVLPTLKTKATQDAEGQESFQISLDRNQVLQIFSQHPVVKRAYDENVPKPLNETDFWSRFFLSRLCKQLKGERVADTDRRDPVFDKYDAAEDQISYTRRIVEKHVPHIIDVEGNEENQGGVKSGNAKDVEMRPRKNVPIIQVLNATSEKLLSNVASTDKDPEQAPSTDEATLREVTLRDLGHRAEENRVMLNIKEQSQFFLDQNAANATPDRAYERQNPSEVLATVTSDLETLRGDKAGGIDLHTGIGVDDESDSDDDTPKKPHVGSRAARKAAERQILDGLAQSRAELYGHSSDETNPMGMPPELAEKAKLTNGTTVEFLKHFWDAFLSGDPDRAQELGYHVESLKRSATRIKAIADEAEAMRKKKMEEERRRLTELYQATGQRATLRSVEGGGQEAVMTLLGPTLAALEKAQKLYQAALEEEGITMSTEND